MEQTWDCIESRTFPTAQDTKKSSTSAQATLVLRCFILPTQKLVLLFVGISGSQKLHGAWRFRVRRFCSTRLLSDPNRRIPDIIPENTGSAPWLATALLAWFLWWLLTASARRRLPRARSLSTVRLFTTEIHSHNTRFNTSFSPPTGSSFITNNFGAVLERADRATESVLIAELDLTKCAAQRAEWGLFRDRRPELYGALMTKDGGK